MTEPLALSQQTSFRHLESPMMVSRKIPTHRKRHQQTITAELTIRALWRGSLRKLLFDTWRAPWGGPLRTFISLFKSAWHHLDGDHAESISRPKGSTAFREMPPSRSLRGNLPPFVWLSIRDISHSPKLPGGNQHFSISSRQRSSRWSDRAATFAQECLASCLRKPRKIPNPAKGPTAFHFYLGIFPPESTQRKILLFLVDEMAEFIGLAPKSPNKGAEVSKFSSRTLVKYLFSVRLFLFTDIAQRKVLLVLKTFLCETNSHEQSGTLPLPPRAPPLSPFNNSDVTVSLSLHIIPLSSLLNLEGDKKRGGEHRETHLESRLDLTLSFCKIATWAGEIWGGGWNGSRKFQNPPG